MAAWRYGAGVETNMAASYLWNLSAIDAIHVHKTDPFSKTWDNHWIEFTVMSLSSVHHVCISIVHTTSNRWTCGTSTLWPNILCILSCYRYFTQQTRSLNVQDWNITKYNLCISHKMPVTQLSGSVIISKVPDGWYSQGVLKYSSHSEIQRGSSEWD